MREEIGRKLIDEKRQKSVDAYVRSLREASDIRMYAAGKELESLVGLPDR